MPSGIDWSRRFDEPIPLPGGGFLRTLREAADHIQNLPRNEHALPHWQTAIEHLIYAAEREAAWLWLARIAMMQALNHGRSGERAFPRAKAVKRYRIIS